MIRRICTVLLLAAAAYAQTASFPTTLATDSDLLTGITDRAESQLAAAIDATTLSIPVNSGSPFAANMLVTIENEQIKICGVTGNTLTACPDGRHYAGTSAATHAQNKTVRGQITAWQFKRIAKELMGVESYLSRYQAGWKTSETVVLFPNVDQIYASQYLLEQHARSGRHFAQATVLDLCGAVGTGACTVVRQDGAGDKVSAYIGAQAGLPATTTLTAGIGSTDLLIPLASTSIISTTVTQYYPVRIRIDAEEILICGTAGNTAVVCTGGRGAYTTAQATHANGATAKGISDVWGMNIQTVKRGDIGANVNVNGLEIDVHEYFEDWTNTAGQRGTTALIATSAGAYHPSHGFIINSTTSANSWWLPVLVQTDSQRGILVGPATNPIDQTNTKANFGGKQLENASTVFFGQRYTDSSPEGYFYRYWTLAGTEIASMDVNGKIKTVGSIQAVGGAPAFSLQEGDAAANNQLWKIVADGGTFNLFASSDDETTNQAFLTARRSGTATTWVNIAPRVIQGVPGSAPTDSDISANQCSIWNNGGTLTFRCRDNGGSYFTKTL